MRKRLIKIVFAILGIGIGYSFFPWAWRLANFNQPWLVNPIMNMFLGLVIMSFLGLLLSNPLEALIKKIESSLLHQKPEVLITEGISMIVGLVIAALISTLFSHSQLFFFNTILPVVLMIIFGYLGFIVGKMRFSDLPKLFALKKKAESEVVKATPEEEVLERKVGENFYKYKLLDTNILIDGRIYDLAKTGFLEGTLIVPNFVLYELQYIADSGDSIKRVRGRRGLDILNKLRTEKLVPVEMYEGDFEDIQEVDTKLIKLAKLLDAEIITNDYNLNKVSEFQNVRVLNVNALAKSLKPRVIPGEKLNVMVIKNGTERQQGVAYLDDGTMIVVEDGRYFMNKTIEVEVTSAIQTDAGRMIFAKPAHSRRELNEKN
ncbi:MAG: PIN domain nuclease [Ligilactobacillus agilis]|uniref:PIN/TRAM domain-containing protein n=1 Tax=Ligilactobacillus agilis TaxID=1601 RepID=UPI00242F87E7|nr:PIN domain-containing protein [Ligilactobacillus agilis]MCI5761182.1 PIN domain nuclease [Ligilactobacillus agilis]MCL8206051.1 PIN domain nuclease [Ligilactobacillus agilis]MDY4064672.1 PIN domain nuclease [Ligilactobacillus agilis]